MALTDNINAYWKFNESSGNATDEVNSNTLTNTNSVTYSAGKMSNGANFASASSQYFTRADTASLSITDDISFSFWINPATLPSSGNDMFLINKDDVSNQRSYSVYLYNNGGTQEINIFLSQTGNASTYCVLKWGYTLSTATWTYVVVTTDISQANNAKSILYINGTSQGNGSVSAEAGTPSSIYDGTATFQVADRNAALYFNGSLDEMGIWARILTSGEVTSLYNSGNGLTYPFTTTSVKTINGLAQASVKTINGLAIASVKTINGLA